MTSFTIRAYNIAWDEADPSDNLPDEVSIVYDANEGPDDDDNAMLGYVAEWMSDNYGFTVVNFAVEVL